MFEEEVMAQLRELQEAHQHRIERVVCSGGGAKGVVYAGAYKAMEKTGMLKNIKEFSGASAGAITAAFMAIGMPTEQFRNKLLDTNFKDLMGNSAWSLLGKNPPGVSFLTKDGKPLENFIRTEIINTINTPTLNTPPDTAEEKDKMGFNLLKRKLAEENPKITFGDLALLNRCFPDRFKKLTVPAVKFPGGDLQIFNAELTPDVEIALACRASASIPVVMEPVEIEIDGVKQKFVDGGMFDNLPTDYFDTENGKFIPNQKPMQTMVFAFGEGLNDKKNQVFQALYNKRWDETIINEFLKDLLNEAFIKRSAKLAEDESLKSPEEEVEFIIQLVKLELNKFKQDGKITEDEEKKVMNAVKQATDYLLLKSQEHPNFLQKYLNEPQKHLEILINFIKKLMAPILYKAGFVERLKRNVLVELLGDLHASYKNTEQKEKGYQKLRSEYPLRTVELRVGDLKTTDFNQATQLARIMDSLGYLDTVNHITNHDLHYPEQFDVDTFYVNLVNQFETIYQATLKGCGKEPEKNELLHEIEKLKVDLKVKNNDIKEGQICKQVYQLIKDRVEPRLDSIEAFALSRAVEYSNQTIDAGNLFKEIYEEAFKRSSIFSVSEITGESIFKSATLSEVLKNKDMFELHSKRDVDETSRTHLIFESLQNLPGFVEETQLQSDSITLERTSI